MHQYCPTTAPSLPVETPCTLDSTDSLASIHQRYSFECGFVPQRFLQKCRWLLDRYSFVAMYLQTVSPCISSAFFLSSQASSLLISQLNQNLQSITCTQSSLTTPLSKFTSSLLGGDTKENVCAATLATQINF